MERTVPLSGGFLVISIVGFIISLFIVYNKVEPSWGISFMLVFMAMFLASFISLHKLEADTLIKVDKHIKKPKI